jgi:transposase
LLRFARKDGQAGDPDRTVNARGSIECNPSRRRPNPYDVAAYKVRNGIERCLDKLKHYRRIATRFDRRAMHDLGSLPIAAALLWMR